jgi:hypothetical protein
MRRKDAGLEFKSGASSEIGIQTGNASRAGGLWHRPYAAAEKQRNETESEYYFGQFQTPCACCAHLGGCNSRDDSHSSI